MKNTVEEPPITSFSQLEANTLYTYADYLKWQFKERVELIKGKIMRMSPAPSSMHQRISGALHFVLFGFFKAHTCQVFAAPFDVRLPIADKKGQLNTVVQPDLCVICDPAKIDDSGCLGAPDLMVEILSPGNSSREMRDKFEVYQESGVKEYWIIHPSGRVAFPYVLNEAGVFIGQAPVTDEDVLQSYIFPDLAFPLKEILGEE